MKRPWVSEANRKRVYTDEQRKHRSSLRKKEWESGIRKGGYTCSDEHKRKNADAHRGEKAYNWITDRTKLAKASEHRNDTAHREWAKSVKNRDNWKCKISNDSCSGNLEAHHILSYKDYPELRYQTNNGITLCHAHHPKGRAEEKRFEEEFQKLIQECQYQGR